MADPVMAARGPSGLTATALAQVSQVEGLGMVTIRADLDRAGDAIAEAAGVALPARTCIVTAQTRALGWMAPDELLLMLPLPEVAEAITALCDALTGEHCLIADVSDMRATFDVIGTPGTDGAAQVLAKLSPTDMLKLAPDALRRTRLAQVPAAFWQVPGGYRVTAFRSVAVYVRDVLENAAAPGSWLDPR